MSRVLMGGRLGAGAMLAALAGMSAGVMDRTHVVRLQDRPETPSLALGGDVWGYPRKPNGGNGRGNQARIRRAARKRRNIRARAAK